jgi:hypothetical protein
MTAAAPNVWRRLCHTRLRDALRGRFDASLDWRLIVVESELPAEITDVLGQVVGGSRLWRSEKVDLARELVAHFQDGLDSGQSTAELVKSFGDPRQISQLIRRAKKRGRSPVWHLWRYVCWTVGAIAVFNLAASLYMALDRPSVTTDYVAVMNERAVSVPENQRAWPLYREALLAMDVKPVELDPAQPFVSATASQPGDADWPATQAFLTEHASALSKLREAAARPELGFVTGTSSAAFTEADRQLFGITLAPEEMEAFKHQTLEDRWAIATLLPHLNLMRSAAVLLASDARRAAAVGDGATALDDLRAIFGMSHHCEEVPTMVSVLVSEAVQRQARSAIRDVLRDHPALWTNDQLRDLAHVVAAAEIDWRRGFVGERMCFHDSMQRIYTDDGHGDGRLALNVSKEQNFFELLNAVTASLGASPHATPPHATPLSNSGLAMLAMPVTNMVVASRSEMTEMYERLTDRAQQRLETPLWEPADSPTIDDEIRAMQTGPLSKMRYLFVNLLFPGYDALRSRYTMSQGERDGVLIGLALELYHREHGKWPANLAELSPRWLPHIPVDRITGELLKFKIVDDRPIVYSIGVDGNDDGGMLPSACEGDATQYPVSALCEYPTATKHMKDQHLGDWVIWSTVKPSIALSE